MRKKEKREYLKVHLQLFLSLFISIVVLLLPTVPHFCIAYTQTLLFLVNASLTPDTPLRFHICAFISSNIPKHQTFSPWCSSTYRHQVGLWHTSHTTHIHTGHSDEWSPQGRAVKLRPLPPAILLSLALHTHSLISFSSLWPRSHSHLFLTSSLIHSRMLQTPLHLTFKLLCIF